MAAELTAVSRTENDVATDPAPWMRAWRTSHNILRAAVEPLDLEQLEQPSYDDELVDRPGALPYRVPDGDLRAAPGRRAERGRPAGTGRFCPIWERWNARSPQAQATDALAGDKALLGRFESLDDGQRERYHLEAWGMDLDLPGWLSLRVGEHAVHTWDVVVSARPVGDGCPGCCRAVRRHPRAALQGGPRPTVRSAGSDVVTSSPERHFTLETGDSVELVAFEPDDYEAELQLPAEAFLRLVYGRLDPAHTPPVEARGVDLDELRAVFPGF